MDGQKMLLIAAVVISLVSLCLGAHVHIKPNCRKTYQDTLNEALQIKGECHDAVLYDCCQAKAIHLHNVPSGQYDISEVCADLDHFGKSSGVMLARCDMKTDDGGWMVIQRRANNNSVDFYRNWTDYEQGFGDLDSEFWYGLENIHCLTTRDEMELRIDMEDESGNKVTWIYQQFSVAGPGDKYRLTIGQGEGTPGTSDRLTYHNGQQFSTYDQDNDLSSGNCAASWRGGWWYRSCHHVNLNGDHDSSGQRRPVWYTTYYPYIEMKIRRKTCPTVH